MSLIARSHVLRIVLVAGAVAGLLGVGYLVGRQSVPTRTRSAETAPSGHQAATWSCPMHPQIQEPEAGECPLCGMPLVLQPSGGPSTQPAAVADVAHEVWTCSMHPRIQLPRPGKCPICGMNLIPLEASGAEEGPRTLAMSEEDRKLAQIVTAPVERRFVTANVRMVGKVDFDETRVKAISAWLPGRVDRLYVDYTGITVKKGEHVALVYSPDLLTAQQELIEARRWVDARVPEPSDFLREASVRTLQSAREKLRLLGLSERQVAAIEERGTAEDQVLITSPLAGIVVEKHLQEGDYVRTGSRLYAIADLSHLWVRLDAFESDLQWLRYGQEVTIEAEALPGERFRGFIAFIDPVLHPHTRTVKVRVNVANPQAKLKPEMFVRAIVSSQVAGAGRVMETHLAGKWIGPMHPEVIRDEPGSCPVCGMPLVRSEELGYVSAEGEDVRPVVVPASAVLRTGKRAVVYVEVTGAEMPTYEGREVVLGPRAGDDYVIKKGLQAGERVVLQGNFKIDSALQIRAKPSMMSPEGGAPAPVHQHGDGGMPAASRETRDDEHARH